MDLHVESHICVNGQIHSYLSIIEKSDDLVVVGLVLILLIALAGEINGYIGSDVGNVIVELYHRGWGNQRYISSARLVVLKSPGFQGLSSQQGHIGGGEIERTICAFNCNSNIFFF